jgi:Spy/CpxP family protein refolding chaperone
MKHVVVVCLLVAAAYGQNPRALVPWWDQPIVRDLNLSEEQHRQIRSALRETRSQMIDLRASVEKAEGEVEDLFNEDSVDQKRTAEAIDKLVDARRELTRAFSMLSLRLRAVLTTQQWRELQRRRPVPQPQPQPRRRVEPQVPNPGPQPRQNPQPE